MLIRLDTTLSGLLQTGSAIVAHGVGLGSQRHDYGIHLHFKLTALNHNRTAASGGVRLTQLHLYAGNGLDMTGLIALNGYRIGEQIKDNPFFLGVVDLLLPGRKLGLGTAINNMDIGAQPLRTSCSIHRHVAAAYNSHLLVVENRGGRAIFVCLHQVNPGQILISRVDAH